jgi:hypothetical protein
VCCALLHIMSFTNLSKQILEKKQVKFNDYLYSSGNTVQRGTKTTSVGKCL